METLKEVKEGFMKVVVRISDVMALARRFEQSPTQAMQEVMTTHLASLCTPTEVRQ
jgi:hypothetical protein